MLGITLRHNLLKSGILRGKTDIHCHVLPGVDDGSPDVSRSLEMLSFMDEEMGFRCVCLTPHVMQDYPNDTAMLQTAFDRFLPNYKGPMRLLLAAEYMLDASFSRHLHDGILPLGREHLLVETSYMSAPVGFHDILLDIWHRGYRPVLAHPERYMYMEESDYTALRSKGYAFQLNLLSLSGYYGRRPKQVSEYLLKQGYYNYAGTDLHHLERYEDYLYDMKLTRQQLDAIEQLFENNEQRLDA